jgi:hypothetical protein
VRQELVFAAHIIDQRRVLVREHLHQVAAGMAIGQDVAPDSADRGIGVRLDQLAQPIRIGDAVGVRVGDDLRPAVGQPQVARRGRAAGGAVEVASVEPFSTTMISQAPAG